MSHETGDPCLKPRSFSQPQILFQQFCLHEIRLTNKYRLLYSRGVPLGHIGTGVAILARGSIWLSSANMT